LTLLNMGLMGIPYKLRSNFLYFIFIDTSPLAIDKVICIELCHELSNNKGSTIAHLVYRIFHPIIPQFCNFANGIAPQQVSHEIGIAQRCNPMPTSCSQQCGPHHMQLR
jgi:hypothetical protein